MTLATGDRLGRYEILGDLGAWGMGEVYLARDTALDRGEAVKLLSQSVAWDSDRIIRFEREAKSAASLVHGDEIRIGHKVARFRFVVDD